MRYLKFESFYPESKSLEGSDGRWGSYLVFLVWPAPGLSLAVLVGEGVWERAVDKQEESVAWAMSSKLRE